MLNAVQNILLKYTKTDRNSINETTALAADLGLSSFDVVSIVTEFEDEFDIEIPDRDIRKMVTVGDILAYLDEKV